MAKKAVTREDILEQALSDIRGRFGEGAIMRLGDEVQRAVEVIHSGILPLDVALGIDAGGVAPDATLMLDRSLVEEVLGNILGNACDYARARVRMVLSLDDDHRTLAMSVADDGPGFSPEALHRGCEPFFGEAKSSEHFGLGLNIVSTLARLHGGSVTLANGEDGGGAVTVTFDVGSEA